MVVEKWVFNMVFRKWEVLCGDFEVGVVNLVVGKYVG